MPEEKRKVRERNKNKKITSLKNGDKLEISFYNNRAVGENHAYWSRHLGTLMHNPHICPVWVQTWKDINEVTKKHMWAAIKVSYILKLISNLLKSLSFT